MPHTLDPLFRPQSVAVIGASRERHTVGGSILHNLLSFEFQGQVFPVNPRAHVVHSLKAYPSVEDIPDPIDLAVIAVPKQHVMEVLESCARKGVRAVVIVTAGFKEVGEAGARLEQQVVDLVRRYRMRLVGPNCMGVINMDPAVRLQASFSANQPESGPVAFSSQSGALGEAILSLLRDRGLGLSMFVSLGNKADVSGNDLIAYWDKDPQTRVILMYLESFGNPKKFLQLCRRVSKKKPILAVKSGRTAAGARAAASHTGSLAGAENAVDSLFLQSGVIRAATIEELFVYAAAFASQPVPRGQRVAIVTNSGGPGILATDACIQLGLEIPTLGDATQALMRAAVAPEATVVNPVDMIATAGAAQYGACVRAVVQDPTIDAVIVIFTSLELIDGPSVATGIVSGAAGADKPVLVCFMGSVRSREAVDIMRRAGLAVYTFPEDAAHALAAMVQYRRWQERPPGEEVRFDDMRTDLIRQLVSGVRLAGRVQLTLVEAMGVFEAAGVPFLPWREVLDPDHAAEAATTLGMPVALKISSTAAVHKSEIGGVQLGLMSADAIRRQAHAMLQAVGAVDPQATLVVQSMAAAGTEVILGSSRDPKFGSLMMFGLGGIFVEVLNDVAFRGHPLSDIDARDMIRGVKGYAILTGARGHAAVDLALLETTLLRLSQLLTECPEIQEFDINPFFAAPVAGDSGAADARITLGDSR